MNTNARTHFNRRQFLAATVGVAAALPGSRVFAQTPKPIASPIATPVGTGRLTPDVLNSIDELLATAIENDVISGGVISLDLPEENRTNAQGVSDTKSGAALELDAIFRVQSMTKIVTAVVMTQLIAEGKFSASDPVVSWLPELADRKVLVDPEGDMENTVAAEREITIDDLLTFRSGYGMMMDQPPSTPIHVHMAELGVAPGANLPQEDHDSWLAKFTDVPLLHQPGAAWRYDTAAAFEGILISRIEGKPLSDIYRERIFEPLGMVDTGYYVPEDKIHRLPVARMVDYTTGEQAVFDTAESGTYAAPPIFEGGNDGLVSTAADWNLFTRALLSGGTINGVSIASEEAVKLITSDHLTLEQKEVSPWYEGYWDNHGWGYGVAITTVSYDPSMPAGQYGWDGGLGTSWISDPNTGLVATILIQQMLDENVIELLMEFQMLAMQAVVAD